MYPVSDLFKLLVKKRDSVLIVKADVAGEEYERKDIIDFSIESKLVTGEEFEIGTVIISQLVIKIKLKAELPKNARIIPYVAYDTRSLAWDDAAMPWEDTEIPWEGGTSEWMPMGEFYIDSRKQDGDVWRIVCLDKLIWSETEYKSTLTFPASMQAVWDDMCTQLGYTYDSSVQINPSYMIEVKPIGYTCRKIMGWIAGANSASVKAGKNGKIQFKRYVADPVSDFKLTLSDYIHANPTDDIKTYNRFVVTYDDEQDLSFEAGEGSEGETLYFYNPFMTTQNMVDELHATLGGYSYQPIQMDVRGYPHFDVGDEMVYDINESLPWDYTLTAWEDTHIPWNGLVEHRSVILNLKLRYAGGFGMALDAPSKTDQQSEFVVVGPVNQKVNQLNKTAVKLGRNYYGFKTSREFGMEIVRDDGLSYLQLNSDVMDWQVEGQSVLYFDAIAKELRFAGTLYGADGVFSGTLEAGIIIGSEIEGSIIRGTNIYGGSISTRETGYPRIVISDTTDLLSAEYSNNRKIMIDPNNYLTNQFPHLRWISDGYEAHIHHAGLSGLQIDANAVDFWADITMQGGSTIWVSNASNMLVGNTNLQSLLDARVPQWLYESEISSIENRLSALENP